HFFYFQEGSFARGPRVAEASAEAQVLTKAGFPFSRRYSLFRAGYGGRGPLFLFSGRFVRPPSACRRSFSGDTSRLISVSRGCSQEGFFLHIACLFLGHPWHRYF